MTHLHKLPAYRNPETKARAVVSRMTHNDNCFFVDVFEFRKQTSFKSIPLKGCDQVKAFLQRHGYTQHIGG